RLSSEKTSFSQLLLQARMDRALQLILDNELPLSSVSESIGISSMPYFIRVFKYFFWNNTKTILNLFQRINYQYHFVLV
ncbi:TPA: helix-turn-helix domain-containing protein, partial [Escherichia coli]|nr:helix-turn-helix domain-containing protein [Escherichia coli]